MRPLALFRMARAAYRLVKDPTRLDEVIAIADDIGANHAQFRPIVDHVRTTAIGAAALRDRPRVDLVLARLRLLPDGSFGREAARFLDDRRLDPEDLPRRPAADEYAWLHAHLFETHDLWHVVTGFDTDVAGEAGLQAFYLAQFPARLASVLLAVVFLNTFLFRFDDRDPRMEAIVRGWQLGKAARPLTGVDWNQLWELPLAEVRARLGLPAARAAAAA